MNCSVYSQWNFIQVSKEKSYFMSWKDMGELAMHTTKWKKPVWKGYMTFQKRQNCGDNKSIFKEVNGRERWIDLAQRSFRAAELLCVVLWWCIHVIKYLRKLIECTPRVYPKVNNGLWVIMMCQCRFVGCDPCTLWWAMLNVRVAVWVWRQGVYRMSLYFLLIVALSLKLLKKLSLLRQPIIIALSRADGFFVVWSVLGQVAYVPGLPTLRLHSCQVRCLIRCAVICDLMLDYPEALM